ncbi:hypothetical protein LguiA_015507 [Lonicera macranthoides]
MRCKHLKWNFSLKDTGRKTINKVSRSCYSITPNVLRHMSRKKEGTSHIKQVTIFFFRNSILFWCLWTRCLVNNAMCLKIFAKSAINIFSPIIRPKNFNGAIILCMNEIAKGLES